MKKEEEKAAKIAATKPPKTKSGWHNVRQMGGPVGQICPSAAQPMALIQPLLLVFGQWPLASVLSFFLFFLLKTKP